MNKKYIHLVLEGTPYDIGKKLGEYYSNDTSFIDFMSSPFLGAKKRTKKEIEKTTAAFDKYCPDLNEEMQGFSDATNIKSEDLVFYFSYIQSPCHCSQFTILPNGSSDGNIYHGRNYDFGWEDDRPLLLTTKSNNHYAHIGFALQLFGRYDGMNEKGLCISTASSQVMPELNSAGFVFPGVVRSLLDNCRNVREAAKMLEDMPISDCRNFLITDELGQVALVETYHEQKAIKVFDSSDPYVLSMDNNSIEQMKNLNLKYPINSIIRGRAAEDYLNNNLPLDLDTIKELLNRKYPNGLYMPYYSQGMGTMWSMVFCPESKSAYIRFGSNQTKWHTFNFDTPSTIYEVELIDDTPQEDIYKRVSIEGHGS